MTTIRQIGGLWGDGQNKRLFAELARFRSDIPEVLIAELGASALATAALAVVRLQELSQTRTSLYRGMLARLVATQEANGGWSDDVLVTVLATRALLGDRETRPAAMKGLTLLASLQKDDGSLPRGTVRRLPGDAIASAFALIHLGRSNDFAAKFRLEAAVHSLTAARATVPATALAMIKLAVQRASSSIGGQASGLLRLTMES